MSEENDKEKLSEKELDKIFRSNICIIANYKLEKSIRKWISKINYDIPMKEFKNMILMYNITTNKELCGEFREEPEPKPERKKESKESGYYL